MCACMFGLRAYACMCAPRSARKWEGGLNAANIQRAHTPQKEQNNTSQIHGLLHTRTPPLVRLNRRRNRRRRRAGNESHQAQRYRASGVHPLDIDMFYIFTRHHHPHNHKNLHNNNKKK